MSATHIAILGAIAGATIFLGLPIGRLRSPARNVRAALNAVAAGILLFLLWDVLAHGWETVDAALGEKKYGAAAGTGLVLAAGLTVGLLGLVYFERAIRGDSPSQLALFIAIGIGLHNFAEGLAIGNSAAQGEIALAVL